MEPLLPFLDTLVQQAHADGGWGYAPGQVAHLEPTCLGLLALSLGGDRYADALARAKQALARNVNPDGSFRLERGRPEAVWPTALGLFVKSVLGDPDEEQARSAAFLLALKGRVPENAEKDEVQDIDLTLVGWPWGEGNFSWAEPTSWACLALRRVGQEGHARVEEGVRLLLDRSADEGGINYGNRKILGRTTEPIPGPTAIMLIALQGMQHPRIDSAVHYLTTQANHEDLEHLCWIKLALHLHREQPGVAELLPVLDARIRQQHEDRGHKNWVRPHPLRQALTVLALGADQHNVFELPANPHALTLATGSVAAKKGKTLGNRLGSWFRGMAVTAVGQLKTAQTQTEVHIGKAADYSADLAGVLAGQYENFRERVPLKGKRVVLKPNLVEYHRDKVINTHPNVVAAAIELCKREGAAEIIVAEGPGHWRNVEYLVQASGLADVLKHYAVPFIDLNHDEPVKTPNLGRATGMEYLYLTQTIMRSDVLISMPKLKTHHWAGATLSMKNLFGTLPGICYGWPKNELHWRGIDNSIVDINITRPPDLAIVDGIIGMEGDGPLNGTAKPMGILVMGSDVLATDATCCRLMKLAPEKVGYLVLGHAKKLGLLHEAQIEQRGEKISDIASPFATVPHWEHIRVA